MGKPFPQTKAQKWEATRDRSALYAIVPGALQVTVQKPDTRMHQTHSFSWPGPGCGDPRKDPDRVWSVLSINSISARLVPACSRCPQPSPVPSEDSCVLPIPPGPSQPMSVLLCHLCSGRCEPCKEAEGRTGQGWAGLLSSAQSVSEQKQSSA